MAFMADDLVRLWGGVCHSRPSALHLRPARDSFAGRRHSQNSQGLQLWIDVVVCRELLHQGGDAAVVVGLFLADRNAVAGYFEILHRPVDSGMETLSRRWTQGSDLRHDPGNPPFVFLSLAFPAHGPDP